MRYFLPSRIFQIKEGNHVIDSIEYIYTYIYIYIEREREREREREVFLLRGESCYR